MKASAWHKCPELQIYMYVSIYIFIDYKWYIAAAFFVAIEFDVQVSRFL